ncbi:hypothetical protein JAAARDRAFT_199504 [Jaapia argillacea MUCL 33604]|uniref:Uncharacterized protein n=1 Tax=Jaapia argillacea MUCL 33604 TaxID=933084 RepID=A0A067P888_9AGAM|nr:hypothetical protein JAAARDRAFT_199504 [Jaapia argillacea MUCL 33604]
MTLYGADSEYYKRGYREGTQSFSKTPHIAIPHLLQDVPPQVMGGPPAIGKTTKDDGVGMIYGNKAGGALIGLTQRFVRNDTHILCMLSQIGDEIGALFNFMEHVCEFFGFEFRLELSTRSDKYLGIIEAWDEAGATNPITPSLSSIQFRMSLTPPAVLQTLDTYGPSKMRTQLRQWSLRRSRDRRHHPRRSPSSYSMRHHPTRPPTPECFNLKYRSVGESSNPPARPVMIPRAILRSMEKFAAIVTENFDGKWSLWLPPRQSLVIPVSTPYDQIHVTHQTGPLQL